MASADICPTTNQYCVYLDALEQLGSTGLLQADHPVEDGSEQAQAFELAKAARLKKCQKFCSSNTCGVAVLTTALSFQELTWLEHLAVLDERS